jgi:DNA-directed RNA polymerase specialized sigma24 family protein
MGTSVQTLPGITDRNQPSTDELFTAVYREYAPMVRRVVAANLNDGHRDLADDLMQETFLRIWRQGVQLDQIRSLSGFLRLASRRTVLDHYKVKRNKAETPADAGHWSFTNREMDPAGGCYTPAATGFRTARIGGAR